MSARVSIKVQPRARTNAIEQTPEGFKVRLNAPPVDGKANEACVRFLAGVLGVPRSSVRIVQGETSRNKVVEVDGLSLSDVEQRLRAACVKVEA
jgi:uncharacterized protein (TIGR00251 family)